MATDLLTEKQQRFVDEYLKDLNGTLAYKRAGYTANNDAVAAASASALLRNPKVAAIIDEKIKDRYETVKISQEYVLTNLREVVERCMQRAPVLNPFTGEQVKDEEDRHVWKFDPKGVNQALSILGKHVGVGLEQIANLNIDMNRLTTSQVERLANGESLLAVLSNP